MFEMALVHEDLATPKWQGIMRQGLHGRIACIDEILTLGRLGDPRGSLRYLYSQYGANTEWLEPMRF